MTNNSNVSAKSVFLISLFFVISCQTVTFRSNPDALIPKMPMPKEQPELVVVLGGGGARGLAHIGVLEVLEEEGLLPDTIIGCSAGAIIGGLYALHANANAVKMVLLPKSSSAFLEFHVADFPFGLFSNSGLERFLQKEFGNKRFQDLEIPFISVATNLQNGELYPFFTGPVVKPILASSAIPGAFNPVEIYGTYFVDGGVKDPVPVKTARDMNAKVVIAVEIQEQLSNEPPSNLLDIMWRSLSINYYALSKQNAKLADVLVEIPVSDVGLFSDNQNVNLYLTGRKKAIAALPRIREVLAEKGVTKFQRQ